jgi:hypothetical protein
MEKWQIVPTEPTPEMIAAGFAPEAEHDPAGVYRAMLAAAPAPPHMSMTADEARTFQQWAGMDGACAFHLIERHASGWGEVAQMMAAWLDANSKPPNVKLRTHQRPAQEQE